MVGDKKLTEQTTSKSDEYTAKEEKMKKLISNAPKAQLHLHLDGSLSYNFISKSFLRFKERHKGKSVFEKNWEPQNEKELVDWLMKIRKDEQSTNLKTGDSGNWRAFDICNTFLQTKEDLVEATQDLVERMATQHCVNYLEIRFAPVLHTKESLSEEDAVLAVIEGFQEAKNGLLNNNLSVDGGVILCALRSYPVSEAIKTVNLIKSLNNKDILAFDIAGDEGSYPLKLFEEALILAKSSKIKITVHAGEWNEKKYEDVISNLRLAVEVGVNRIGHGLALRSVEENDDIFAQMAAKNISVEICLTSNCDNAEKCVGFKEHPLPKFLKNDVAIAALNVDNLLLAGDQKTGLPDPSGEFVRAILDCGLKGEDVLAIVENSYKAAFKDLAKAFIEDALKIWRDDIVPHIEKDHTQ